MGSFYAPTQDRHHEQGVFIDTVEAALNSMTGVNYVLGGDFNCILDPTLDKNSPTQLPAATDQPTCTHGRTKSPISIQSQISKQENLYIQARTLCIAIRSDPHFLSFIQRLSQIQIKAGSQSDHSLIFVKIHELIQSRGPGMWKLNPTLLANQDYVTLMLDFLSHWNPPPELSSPCSTWEWLKHEIKCLTIRFAKDNVSLEKQMIKTLTKNLQVLTERADAGEDLTDQLASTRRELAEVEEIRANKLISRVCSRWTHLGEKPTGYYLNLEKRKAKDRALSNVLLEDGSTTNTPASILEECRSFYENLYREDVDSLSPIEDIWTEEKR